MHSLKGKRFWLVGASVGIGRQLALRLAQEGAEMVVSARSGGELTALLAEISPVKELGASSSSGHTSVTLDVTQHAEVQEAFPKVGDIDGVIYCAGAYEPMSACQPDMDALETIVEVNLTGVLRVMAQCVPIFLKKNSGHIVLIGSISGYRGLPNAWGYGATKAAMIHLAENLRCDLMSTNIRVQICNPGFVATRLTDKNDFRMPFLMSADAAAERIVSGMKKSGKFEIAFPFPLVAILKILAALPSPLFLAIMNRMRSKFGSSS